MSVSRNMEEIGVKCKTWEEFVRKKIELLGLKPE